MPFLVRLLVRWVAPAVVSTLASAFTRWVLRRADDVKRRVR